MSKSKEIQHYTDLNSSNLISMSYNSKTKVLHVDMKNSATYRYEGISQKEIDDIMASESKGSAFNSIIVKQHKGTKQ